MQKNNNLPAILYKFEYIYEYWLFITQYKKWKRNLDYEYYLLQREEELLEQEF